MFKRSTHKRHQRALLLCSGSIVAAVGFGAHGSAFAQSDAGSSAGAVAEVVVTATRVVRDGYQAPTPTTVLGAQEINAKAPANIADYVNQLPSLAGSATPRTTISAVSAGNGGINALNLRNLGVSRTLVLLDGQRVGASSLAGYIDVNQFPQGLVKRVDVVTGGASADWGSDAVAGVVNFVLDKEFTGLKGQVQGGVTTYGDDGNYNVSLTGGTGFLNNRGHILVDVEDEYNAGITGVPRSWYNASKIITNPNYTATNGQPQLLELSNVGYAQATPGGIITAGPLQGTYFGPGGTPLQFTYGSLISNPYMVGGQFSDFGTTGDLDPRLSRQTGFFRSSFDVTDHAHIFGQVSYGSSSSHVNFGEQYQLANLTIKSDNAFIPASVAAQIAAKGITSLTLGTFNQDLGLIPITTNRTSWRPVIGANGDFNLAGSNWTWDIYAQKSMADSYVSIYTTITANYQAAIDSVRNAAGTIVCRSTLTNPSNGCVPYDIFGTGVNTQAAIDYVKGTAWLRTQITEDVVAGNLHGNPFSDWAGPISVAAGFEHRRESVTGSNDALSPTKAYFAGNYTASHGSYEVTEGYFETVVPLAKEQFLAKSLDLNGSVRATDYSLAGFVTTWKVGATYSPFDDVSLRVTRSRDIRAPNLSELFQANSTVTQTFTDPSRNNSTVTAFAVTTGNLNLKPEIADTTGIGFVVKPRFLQGFVASVDYYDIDIKGAISTIAAATVVNQCAAGNTTVCAEVIRNSAGIISSVLVQPINIAEQISRGLDIEASYRRPLDTVAPFLKGNMTLRVLATHFLENYTNNGISAPTNTVGTNYGGGSAASSLPHWRYDASARWEGGPTAVTFTARGFSDGVYNTSYVECGSSCPTSTVNNMTISNNHIPGAIYFDANLTYKLPHQREIFLSVDNLANTPPAQVAWNGGGAPLSVNSALYDLLGRTFRVGFRFKM